MCKLRCLVDDPPITLLQHVWQYVFYPASHTAEVDCNNLVPRLPIFLVKRLHGATNTGIVDHDINPSELCERCVNRQLHLLVLDDIDLY